MKKTLILFASLLFVMPSMAQLNNTIAELWQKYHLTETDTSKARILDDLSSYYQFINIDSAFILNKEALQLARKHHHKKLETDIQFRLSTFFLQIGAAQPALEIQFKLLEESKKNKDLLLEQWLYNNIAMNYSVNLGDLENAKKYSYLSMQIPGWELQKKYCTSTFLNLGDIYTRLSQYDSARHYLNKAFELSNSLYGEKDTDYSSMIKNNFGNLYLKMNQPEMALLYYRQSLPYALATNYTDVICESGLGVARI
ncbi:MAG: tetratricopeptide repeat protein [Sediminibacterium sp.]